MPARKTSALCPNPFKMSFVTFDLAWDWVVANHEDDRTIRPYRCECGAIHNGHDKYGLTPEQKEQREKAVSRSV